MALSIGRALQVAADALTALSESPRLDARVLVGHVLHLEYAALIANSERLLTVDQQAQFSALLERLRSGEPLPYVTGERAFFRHDFVVTPDVLIPRPETEHLVEAALRWVEARSEGGQGMTLLDVGTGSGAIAVSLAAALPGAVVHAVDVSAAALSVAAANAQRAGVSNVQFHQSDLLASLPADLEFDLVAANLPYIPAEELLMLAVARSEPRLALDGGPDGLDIIRRLLEDLPACLRASYCVLLEFAATQGQAVNALCRSAFPGANTTVIKDYAGHDRLIEVTS